jgi:hypothetical protein
LPKYLRGESVSERGGARGEIFGEIFFMQNSHRTQETSSISDPSLSDPREVCAVVDMVPKESRKAAFLQTRL